MKSKLFTKNFTFLILGQAVSMFGTNILKFSISLYILDLTGSAALFGIITVVSCIPPVFLSPFGGILADRKNKKNLMASLDFGYSIISVILGIVLLRLNSLIMIGGLLILLSVISSFETPVVQSSIPLVMTENNLVKANATVNQAAMLSGLPGPLLAGVLYSCYGMYRLHYIMFLCALCFASAAVIEMFLHIPKQEAKQYDNLIQTIKYDFAAAWTYITKDKPFIGKVILLNTLFLFLIQPLITVGAPYIILVSLKLNSIWNSTSQMLMGAAGIIGGLIATLIAGKFAVRKVYQLFIGMGIALVFAAMGLFFPFRPITTYSIFNSSCVAIFVLASIAGIFITSAIQNAAPIEMLGRVMSLYSSVMNAAFPIGMSVYGILYEHFSDSLYIVLTATVIFVVVVGFVGKRSYRLLEITKAE